MIRSFSVGYYIIYDALVSIVVDNINGFHT
jgi:hypothetical protein